MENEVSGIAKLGIVLIALAVLIGLGFGIFQISKGTANTGVNNVQGELEGVSQSGFTTYDQTTITGTMATSALSDFEGENIAVLVATKAWVNALSDSTGTTAIAIDTAIANGSGFGDATTIPVTLAFKSKTLDTAATTVDSKGEETGLAFINYNAIIGDRVAANAGIPTTSPKTYVKAGTTYYCGGIYFDENCYRTDCGFLTDTTGRVQFNNVIGNCGRTGRTEYIPSSGKFDCFLLKDQSGTIMGVTMQQL